MTTEQITVMPDFDVEYGRRLVPLREQIPVVAAELLEQLVYGDERTAASLEAYGDMMRNGGKGLRGVLTIAGIELATEKDINEMDEAQRAVAGRAGAGNELIHVFFLGADDVFDESDERRNQPAIHKLLAEYAAIRWQIERPQKVGENMAINSGIMAGFYALRLINRLLAASTDKDTMELGLDQLLENLIHTGEGQSRDMTQPTDFENLDETELLKTSTLKTAYYTFLLPLQLGAALGGASKEELLSFREYSLKAGLAFQLIDDVLGLFGDREKVGKSPKSDIIEGKATVLMARTMKLARDDQRAFLLSALGNPDLSDEDFEKVKYIIESCGAKEEVEGLAMRYAMEARQSLDEWPERFRKSRVALFLGSMTLKVVQREK